MSEEKYTDFVLRHADPINDTLNYVAVIQRLEELIDQYCYMKNSISANYLEISRLNSLNYYVVGAVTCLEWHARGRLVDFVSAMPQKIDQGDFVNFRNAIVNVARNSNTVAQLIGAMKHVSSVDDYVGVFDRILAGIGSGNKTWDLIRSIVNVDGRNKLEDLFEERHSLVHEITSSQIGHYVIRDPFDFESAIFVLNMVLSIVNAVEAEIQRFAPKDFPNLPAAFERSDYMDDLIEGLESEIDGILSASDDGSREAWRNLTARRKSNWEMDKEDIRIMHALRPVRWADYRAAIIKKILNQRYELLKYLKEKLE